MRAKTIIFLLLISSFVFIGNTVSVVAQEPEVIGHEVRCLSPAEYYPPTCLIRFLGTMAEVEKCRQRVPSPTPYPNPSAKDHTLKIKGKGFTPGKDVYLVACISTGNNYICTAGTGSKYEEANRRVNSLGFAVESNPNVEVDGETVDVAFEMWENPVKADSNGEVEAIVRAYTSKELQINFFGITPVEGGVAGRGETVQYGSFQIVGSSKECVTISWDPKGRVFDAKSLEPLPDVWVRILDEDGKLFTQPGLKSVQKTRADGLFSFFVPQGKYKLGVSKEGYQFPVDLKEVNPNFSKVYGCDPSVGSPLYNDQYVIDERGGLVKCDVPLNPLGEPYRSTPTILDFGHVVLPGVPKVVRYVARFSHPLAKGVLKTESGRVVASAVSDKEGRWKVDLPLEKVPQDESLVLEVKKTNLVAKKKEGIFDKIKDAVLSLVNLPILAQDSVFKTKVRFDPILRYVEGYAYDSTGKKIANARVRIVSVSTGKPILEVQADEKGFFRILPEFLPQFSYYIEVSSGNSSPTVYTTSEFVRQNKAYLDSQGVDLVKVSQQGNPITFSSQERKEIRDKTKNLLVTGERTSADNNVQDFSQKSLSSSYQQQGREKQFVWATIFVLVVFLVGIGASLFFYVRSRKL